jgi:bifunctional NMN adenylyltransferase/nudix hydrolase
MDYEYCVFIGRFQPCHKAHLQVIRQAYKEAKTLIMVIGSARAARNIKNPFTYDERVELISSCLTPEELARTRFVPARDYHYSDTNWVTEVQQRVNAITGSNPSVCLIGTYKDASSYYVKLFPQWDFIPANNHDMMDATEVRRRIFSHEKFDDLVETNVHGWIFDNFLGEPVHQDLTKEFEFIQDYKKKWANVPFPVTFQTVDTVVIQSGHVLIVQRKHNPGKGLYALPGGFLKQNERLEDAAIRELKEETGIKVHAPVLKSNVADHKTFDYPGRSLRGRTITTAYCIKLPDGELPEVRGMDDAERAIWMPLMDVMSMEESFYEDHAHIIRYFVNRF